MSEEVLLSRCHDTLYQCTSSMIYIYRERALFYFEIDLKKPECNTAS